MLTHDYKRYVGAQIGIYNPEGEKVGRVSHLRNKEYVYVVDSSPPKRRAATTVSAPAEGPALVPDPPTASA